MNYFNRITYYNVLPSDIIRRKLYENGGSVVIPLLNGDPCHIVVAADGRRFTSDKLNKYQVFYDYSVFDCIVDLLKRSKQYSAPKGCGHGKEDKVGYGKCTPDTIMGAIALHYFKKRYGESTYDPIFVLAAMLDWAGIARNQRGYMTLNPDFIP